MGILCREFDPVTKCGSEFGKIFPSIIVYFSGQSISGCYCAKKGIITAFFWFVSQKIARPLIYKN